MARKGSTIWQFTGASGAQYALREDGILLVKYIKEDGWKRAAIQLKEEFRKDPDAQQRLRGRLAKVVGEA